MPTVLCFDGRTMRAIVIKGRAHGRTILSDRICRTSQRPRYLLQQATCPRPPRYDLSRLLYSLPLLDFRAAATPTPGADELQIELRRLVCSGAVWRSL